MVAFAEISISFTDVKELYSIAIKEDDNRTLEELFTESIKILDISNKARYLNLLNEEADQNNSFLEIHAGAGGTESQDWAEMLQRMYIRWAEEKKYNVSLFIFHTFSTV